MSSNPHTEKPSHLDRVFFSVGHKHRLLARHLLERHGIHRGQPRLMFALDHQEGMTNSELARLMDVTPATVTNMVKRMEKSGFVYRNRDQNDERIKRVYLTDSGRESLASIKQTMELLEGQLFKDFSAEELGTLHALLMKMLKNVEAAHANIGDIADLVDHCSPPLKPD